MYYVAPGVALGDGETPGDAAARAAHEELGLEVTISELLYAQAFAGVDHFFFLGTAESGLDAARLAAGEDDFELESELGGSYEIARLPVRAVLGFDVRPWELARRVASVL